MRWMPGKKRILPACLAVLAAASPALAHGNVSDRIAILGDRIKSHPGIAALYAERAELLRQHGEFDAALADWGAAEKRDPRLAPDPCVRAQLLLEAKAPQKALPLLAALVKKDPKDGLAWFLLGQAHAGAGDRPAACAAFDAAIPLLNPLLPDQVLVQAGAHLADGHPEQALDRLEAGMRRLGPLVVLQEQAVDIEVGLGRTPAALARLDAVIADFKARKLRPDAWVRRKEQIMAGPTRPPSTR